MRRGQRCFSSCTAGNQASRPISTDQAPASLIGQASGQWRLDRAPQATDLERRVLAHERILQFLLAEMARGDAPLLDRLLVVFSPQGRKAHQHDYTDAEDYAEAFIRQVAKLNEEKAAQKLKVDYPPSHSMTPPREIQTEVPVVVEPRSGVWQVRRSTSHIGDYLDRSAAVETALLIAIAECRLGANVKLVVEGVSIPVGDTERS